MKFGGVLEYSKSDYLKYIPEKLLPNTKIIHKNDSINKIKKVILKEKFEFPILIKPDSGQRGVEIEKINDINALDHFLKTASRSEFLIQEFIDYPQELGILIAKSPDDKSKKITSVTLKKFLTVVGDITVFWPALTVFIVSLVMVLNRAFISDSNTAIYYLLGSFDDEIFDDLPFTYNPNQAAPAPTTTDTKPA